MRLPESTLFRVLRTLEKHEYLHQDAMERISCRRG